MKNCFLIALIFLLSVGCANYDKVHYTKADSKNSTTAQKKSKKKKKASIKNEKLEIIVQNDSILQIEKDHYEEAYQYLVSMIEDEIPCSFKNAVYTVENAYYSDTLSYNYFNSKIRSVFNLCRLQELSLERTFNYRYSDRSTIIKHYAIFSVMSDTIKLRINSLTELQYLPYGFNFENYGSKRQWKNTFTSTLLDSKKGNCQSLSYLYKILTEEYGIQTHFALAPNHIYIKHKSEMSGMYNTELTNGTFPLDAWVMASGYIHTDAIRSGIYMEGLTDKQSLLICLFDLAKGYEDKFGIESRDFILKCCNRALEDFPFFINALLLKAKVLSKKLKSEEENNLAVFNEYENLVIKIHRLGYRKMPEQMYLDWLSSLKENQNRVYK